MTTARAPACLATAMSRDTAARTRPSRAVAGSPASSRGMVNGVPVTFPSGASTATARWPAFTSTATTGSRPQDVQRRDRPRRRLPRRVGVPAAPHRVKGDVVPHRPGGGLRGHLVAPVLEPDRARQPVAPVRPVRQVRERGGELDLQPALVRVPPQRLVAPRLVLLPVGGEEQPRGVPPVPPPCFGQPGAGQVQPGAQQPPAAPRHRYPAVLDLPPDAGQTAPQRLQPQRLGVPLGGRGVPGHPPGLLPGPDGEARLDLPHPNLQGPRARPPGSGQRAARRPRSPW